MVGFGESRTSCSKQAKQQSFAGLGWEKALEKAVGYHKRGALAKALDIYEELRADGVQHPALDNNYAVCLKQKGYLLKARDCFREIVGSDESNIDAVANLAECERELGGCQKALAIAEKALAEEPGRLEYLRIIAGIWDQLGLYEKCLQITTQCIESGDTHIEVLCMHALALCELGRREEAYVHIEELCKKPSLSARDMTRLAQALNNFGQLERAQDFLEKALQLDPFCITAILNKVQSRKEPLNKEELSRLVEYERECDNSIARASALFALGRNAEKNRQFHQAFMFWEEASSLKLESLEKREHASFWERGIKSLRSELKIQARGVEYKPKTNGRGNGRIFIVGLPRSGSTLLETILSRIEGSKDLGESKIFAESLRRVFERWRKDLQLEPRQSVFDALDASKMEDMFAEISAEYCLETNTDPAAGRHGIVLTTDKMLYNYNNVPLLVRAFPGCRIIHNHRHPLDNFLSMFKENFKEGNEFTYDLNGMVEVYDYHMQIMRKAKELYPGIVVDCHYDSLVVSPESYLEDLFDQLGLEWNKSYVESGRTRDLIRTASVVQARSGISAKSLGKWKNYEQEFRPIKAALEARGYVLD